MASDAPHVIWLEQASRNDVALVGGKNASLGEMIRTLSSQGVRVPGGFATTAAAYWRFVDHNELRARITSLLADLEARKLTLAEAGHAIRSAFLHGEWPDDIVEAISSSYREFCEKEGKGALTTKSGVLSATPYGFNTRFGDQKGTNPEELIAAAHAGCFAMALAFALQGAGFTPTRLGVSAAVTLEPEGSGFKISKSALKLEANVPGIARDQFQKIAEGAKAGCPVSKLLKAEITLDLQLA